MGDYFVPLREAESPWRQRWAWRMLVAGLVLLVVCVVGTETALLERDTWLWTPAVLSMASSMWLYWQAGV